MGILANIVEISKMKENAGRATPETVIALAVHNEEKKERNKKAAGSREDGKTSVRR